MDEAEAAAKKKQEDLDREIESIKAEYAEKLKKRKKSKESKKKEKSSEKTKGKEKESGKDSEDDEESKAEKEKNEKVCSHRRYVHDVEIDVVRLKLSPTKGQQPRVTKVLAYSLSRSTHFDLLKDTVTLVR